jgi:hypothetical protein
MTAATASNNRQILQVLVVVVIINITTQGYITLLCRKAK